MELLLLVHAPPVVASDSVIVAPGHIGATPVIAAAGGHHCSMVPLAGCVHEGFKLLFVVVAVVFGRY